MISEPLWENWGVMKESNLLYDYLSVVAKALVNRPCPADRPRLDLDQTSRTDAYRDSVKIKVLKKYTYMVV